MMTQSKEKATPKNMKNATKLVAMVSRRHGIPTSKAADFVLKYMDRAVQRGSCKGWWLKLLDAQFQTHIGPYKRIRCGREVGLAHLIPSPGRVCHDCACVIGEYHVFGCDSEECSNCHEQAFCCDCKD